MPLSVKKMNYQPESAKIVLSKIFLDQCCTDTDPSKLLHQNFRIAKQKGLQNCQVQISIIQPIYPINNLIIPYRFKGNYIIKV
ncbi:unnamed protein product [Paramecium octaurelia]|uniref:Uncharacterized protein n=1 Tax=Paramecium octaurelia TaxID=43137 RepID=A0A8S1XWJ5_PAROT|nr:unnamed protein product [Paramecium octaurelia]